MQKCRMVLAKLLRYWDDFSIGGTNQAKLTIKTSYKMAMASSTFFVLTKHIAILPESRTDERENIRYL